MMREMCEFEDTVAEALTSGQWADDVREHVQRCGHCAELQIVWAALHTAKPTDESRLPAPGLIWWRGQLDERREAARRAVAAIDIMQKLAVAVALVAAIVFGWLWTPVDWGVLLLGAGLLLSTAIVLYGWIRGRI
jgi:hypothetical protein